jgi:uncharacterized glyoxalase superfamily protein PhnB
MPAIYTAVMIINRSAPGVSVVPVLVYYNVDEALDFLVNAFGFTERLRAGRVGRTVHAQLLTGNGAIMIGAQGGEFQAPRGPGIAQYVIVHVDDVDAHYERARRAGASIVQPHRINRSASGNTRHWTAAAIDGRFRKRSLTWRQKPGERSLPREVDPPLSRR